MESRPAKNMCILSSESVIRSYPWFFVCSWYNREDAFDPTMSGVTLRIVWFECALSKPLSHLDHKYANGTYI